jgi:hemerythrin
MVQEARLAGGLHDAERLRHGAGSVPSKQVGEIRMGLQWDRALAVGVKPIDEQHQELFRRVDALLQAVMKGQGKPEVEKLFKFLGSYVVEHFGAEEALMAKYRYPGLASHKVLHADFVKRFGELKAAFEKDPTSGDVSIGLNRFVGSWLRDHIGTIDTAVGKHLKAAGAKEAA